MSNTKTVRRTYVSKKTGNVVTKVYTYDSTKYKAPTKRNAAVLKKSKATTYVFKSGKYSKAFHTEYNRIKSEEGELEAQAFKEKVDVLKRRANRTSRVTNLSINMNRKRLEIEIFLNNFGYTVQDFGIAVAAELGLSEPIPEDYILDKSHWKFTGQKGEGSAIFTAPNGKRVMVEYRYYEGVSIYEI